MIFYLRFAPLTHTHSHMSYRKGHYSLEISSLSLTILVVSTKLMHVLLCHVEVLGALFYPRCECDCELIYSTVLFSTVLVQYSVSSWSCRSTVLRIFALSMRSDLNWNPPLIIRTNLVSSLLRATATANANAFTFDVALHQSIRLWGNAEHY